jgi:histidinol phosphatase-like enzyme
MLVAAAWNKDLNFRCQSFMVGDKATDDLAAIMPGVKAAPLVQNLTVKLSFWCKYQHPPRA